MQMKSTERPKFSKISIAESSLEDERRFFEEWRRASFVESNDIKDFVQLFSPKYDVGEIRETKSTHVYEVKKESFFIKDKETGRPLFMVRKTNKRRVRVTLQSNPNPKASGQNVDQPTDGIQ
jgi:hypothetical protein